MFVKHPLKIRGSLKTSIQCVYLWLLVCNQSKTNAVKECNFQFEAQTAFQCGMLCWASYGHIPWWSIMFVAALKKRDWITLSVLRELILRHNSITCDVLCWNLMWHWQGRASWDFSKYSLYDMMSRLFLHQNHKWNNGPLSVFRACDPLVWKSSEPKMLLTATNIFKDQKIPT